jgi:hypothetical protein
LFIDCPTIGTWFLNIRNFKVFLTNTNVTSRSLNTSWSTFIEQLVNTYIKWYRKCTINCINFHVAYKGNPQNENLDLLVWINFGINFYIFLNKNWKITFIEQLVNTFIKWYRKCTINCINFHVAYKGNPQNENLDLLVWINFRINFYIFLNKYWKIYWFLGRRNSAHHEDCKGFNKI